MAGAYNYSFDISTINTSDQRIPFKGSFEVNYDTLQVSNVNVTGDSQTFSSGIVRQLSTSSQPLYYSVNIQNFQSSTDYSNLNFNYYGQQISSFSSVSYSRNTALANPSRPILSSSQATDAPATTTVVCFTTGTMILTDRGEVPVEKLRVGDLAVTVSGVARPITWIGHRDIGTGACTVSHDQQPIRIRAGAFGSGLPARTLRLSPGHPVLVGADVDGAGGHLVPIMCLINGTTIAREPVTSVTYWHVELDTHDILIAEGLPAESYLDWGDRKFFTEASDHALHNPDFVVPGLAARCRPVAFDGPVVKAELARLSRVFVSTLGADSDWGTSGSFDWIAA